MAEKLPPIETQYLDLAVDILENGQQRDDRTGVGTRSLFGKRMETDLSDGFPLLTTKRVYMNAITKELIWMKNGETDLEYLAQHKIKIWNEWAFTRYMRSVGVDLPPQDSDRWNRLMTEYIERVSTDHEFAEKHSDLGPIYGKQWRNIESLVDGHTIDQLVEVQDTIRRDPTSRRMIVDSWNVAEIDAMALPPCHMLYQFYTNDRDNSLDMVMHQRSADLFLGVPFNMAQYALLLSMMAQTTEREPGRFIHNFGDVHIYNNHVAQVEEQLSRSPRALPTLLLNPDIRDIRDFTHDDVSVENYNPHPAIKAPVAI